MEPLWFNTITYCPPQVRQDESWAAEENKFSSHQVKRMNFCFFVWKRRITNDPLYLANKKSQSQYWWWNSILVDKSDRKDSFIIVCFFTSCNYRLRSSKGRGRGGGGGGTWSKNVFVWGIFLNSSKIGCERSDRKLVVKNRCSTDENFTLKRIRH